MMIISQTIGSELRSIRTSAGFGLTEAAGRSNLSKAALSQWESGARTPSGAALDRLLTTLRVDPKVRARLLTEADPNYARTALASEPAGPMVDLGQVLRGLRLRAGMTQTELAALCAVSQSSIASWELGDGVPAIESLDTVIKVLKATEDEVCLINQSSVAFADKIASRDLSMRLMALHDPKIPRVAREPLIVLLQRDAWCAALHDPSANEILCQVMSWRSAWCRHIGRDDEAAAHARQALKLARQMGNVELAAFAALWLTRTKIPDRTPDEYRMLFASARKWLDKPLSKFLRSQFLLTCAEIAYWARLLDEGENMAKEARDLLVGHRLMNNQYPYSGIEEAIAWISRFQTLRERHECAMDTLQSLPDIEERVYELPALTDAYLFALADMDEKMPAEALSVVRSHMPSQVISHLGYWARWERFLEKRERGQYADYPWVYPLL